MIRKISAAEARPYFDHPTQRHAGMIDPADLHDNGIEYWANGPMCAAFHAAQWPGVLMAHHGCKPKAWGSAAILARELLLHVWGEKSPDLIIGWTKESNRAAVAMARRAGFVVDGKLNLPDGAVLMQSWRP